MQTQRPTLSRRKIAFSNFGDYLMNIGTNAAPAPGEDVPESNDGDDKALATALLGKTIAEEPSTTVVLSIESLAELAAFVSVAVAMSALNNQKGALSALKAKYSGKDLTSAYQAIEKTWAFQKLQRGTDGDFKIDPISKLPPALKCPRKLSAIFAAGGADLTFARTLPWSEAITLTRLTTVCSNRATHSVPLSGVRGKGGFLRTNLTRSEDNLFSVSEDDFLTRNTQSFGGDAGLQSNWVLVLSLVEYEGQEYRLPELFIARPELIDEVSDVLARAGVEGVALLLNALVTPAKNAMLYESQVIVGINDREKTLSVLSPFSLPQEIRRAKFVLAKAFKDDQLELAEQLKKEAMQLDADAIPALKKGATAEEKTSRLAAIAAANKAIAAKKEEQAKARKAYLVVPNFGLPMGGAFPHNVAFGLDSGLQGSNVVCPIYAARPTHALSRKTFFAGSLIQPVEIYGKTLPPCFKPGRTTAALKALRAGQFSDVTTGVIGPLLELKDLLGLENEGEAALSEDAQNEVNQSNEPWAIFVKGDSSLNSVAMAEKLAGLAPAIHKAVKTSLIDAYGAKFPNEYDAELSVVIKQILKLEHA
jgi:hypothetical protein